VTTPFFERDLIVDEGLKLKAYRDSVGIWTIGVGHAYVKAGTVWTREKALGVLAIDIAEKKRDLDRNLAWWRTLNDARQDVLLNMCFNLGINRLLKFKNTLAAIKGGHWAEASAGMKSSLWAKQVGKRATRLSAQMLTGIRIPAV
jgi:lysozyme